MPIANGAHVKIGTHSFRIAFDQDRPYQYSLTPTGDETAFWLFDDWSGGEGNDTYDPLDKIVYHQGNVNPRIPGVLASPPTRNTFSSGTTGRAPDIALSAVAGGRLYIFGETIATNVTVYWYTSNMTSFSSVTDNSTNSSDATQWNTNINRVTAVCSDGFNVYVSGWSSSNGDFQIRQLIGATGVPSQVRAYTGSGNTLPIIGMGIIDKYLYYWNGNKLRYRNLEDGTSADEIVAKTLHAGLTGQTFLTDYWGGMTGGEGSLFFFISTEGNTQVFEASAENAAGFKIWDLPEGFTGKSITFQSSAVIMVGEYQNNAAVFGYSTVSRQPLFLGFLRLGTSISTEISDSSFGTEVLLSERDIGSGGKVFVYDIGTDAFSELDEFTHASGEIYSLGAFKNFRFAAVEDGNDLNLYTWATDDNPSTTVDGRMETGAWDFDLPEDEKQLDGFHVLSNANSTKTVDVYYQDNEDGTWTQAGTATTGFHNYIQVSDATTTVKFRSLRFRVDPKTGAEVYSVSARVHVNTYEETWELLLDLSDEEIDQDHTSRRRNNQYRGSQLRDYIRTIATNKTVVTFLDGARYGDARGEDPDKYSTHTVTVDIPSDIIDHPGEGTMLVRLKSVDVN